MKITILRELNFELYSFKRIDIFKTDRFGPAAVRKNREHEEIRRNTQAIRRKGNALSKTPIKNTPSKNTRSYRGLSLDIETFFW